MITNFKESFQLTAALYSISQLYLRWTHTAGCFLPFFRRETTSLTSCAFLLNWVSLEKGSTCTLKGVYSKLIKSAPMRTNSFLTDPNWHGSKFFPLSVDPNWHGWQKSFWWLCLLYICINSPPEQRYTWVVHLPLDEGGLHQLTRKNSTCPKFSLKLWASSHKGKFFPLEVVPFALWNQILSRSKLSPLEEYQCLLSVHLQFYHLKSIDEHTLNTITLWKNFQEKIWKMLSFLQLFQQSILSLAVASCHSRKNVHFHMPTWICVQTC